MPALARINRSRFLDLASMPVGQVVGLLNENTTVRQVYFGMLTQLGDATERINRLME